MQIMHGSKMRNPLPHSHFLCAFKSNKAKKKKKKLCNNVHKCIIINLSNGNYDFANGTDDRNRLLYYRNDNNGWAF